MLNNQEILGSIEAPELEEEIKKQAICNAEFRQLPRTQRRSKKVQEEWHQQRPRKRSILSEIKELRK